MGSEIIEFLSQNKAIKELYRASAGVSEGYVIQAHTLMVFDVFKEQYSRYQKFYQFNVQPDVRLFQTLKLSIALHAQGKQKKVLKSPTQDI